MIINYSNEEVKQGEKSIFLAGPTPRSNKVVSWRKQAIKYLEELNYDGIVYIPEYSTWETRGNYEDQVMWERNALTSAKVILFWIPREIPDMIGLTTNVEFGYWLHSNKVIYGRPDNAEKIKYLDWLYELDYNKKPINDLKILLIEGLKKLDN